MEWPPPTPPLWAINAGLPEPKDGESFCAYVERLGLDCEWFLEDLTEQTAELVNLRLASLLMDKMPKEFRAHVRMLVAAHVPPGRARRMHLTAL